MCAATWGRVLQCHASPGQRTVASLFFCLGIPIVVVISHTWWSAEEVSCPGLWFHKHDRKAKKKIVRIVTSWQLLSIRCSWCGKTVLILTKICGDFQFPCWSFVKSIPAGCRFQTSPPDGVAGLNLRPDGAYVRLHFIWWWQVELDHNPCISKSAKT